MKIMRHRESGRVRLIMRRQQVLKLCCNHYIVPEMSLQPFGGQDSAWLWSTMSDISDEQAKPEKLAIRFRHAETANKFKAVFEECTASFKQEPVSQEVTNGREPPTWTYLWWRGSNQLSELGSVASVCCGTNLMRSGARSAVPPGLRGERKDIRAVPRGQPLTRPHRFLLKLHRLSREHQLQSSLAVVVVWS